MLKRLVKSSNRWGACALTTKGSKTYIKCKSHCQSSWESRWSKNIGRKPAGMGILFLIRHFWRSWHLVLALLYHRPRNNGAILLKTEIWEMANQGSCKSISIKFFAHYKVFHFAYEKSTIFISWRLLPLIFGLFAPHPQVCIYIFKILHMLMNTWFTDSRGNLCQSRFFSLCSFRLFPCRF